MAEPSLAKELTPEHLFTYKGYVERVIDGDTLKVEIDLGFRNWTRQTLRLRGVDAPEVDTKEGRRAKEFVVGELKNESFVTHGENHPKRQVRPLLGRYLV